MIPVVELYCKYDLKCALNFRHRINGQQLIGFFFQAGNRANFILKNVLLINNNSACHIL